MQGGATAHPVQPPAPELTALLATARRHTERLECRVAVQQALQRRHAAWAQRIEREAAGRLALQQQVQQGMAAYDWNVEDWEWRPTWLPPSLTKAAAGGVAADSRQPLGAAAATKSTATNSTPHHRLLAGMSHALSDLEAPARAAALARDAALMECYSDALRQALQPGAGGCGGGGDGDGATTGSVRSDQQPSATATTTSNAHVLVLGDGASGVLALLAAAAGAQHVTVIERHPMGLRVAKQLVDANTGLLEAAGCHVKLVPAPLERCRSSEQRAGSSDVATAADDDGTEGSSPAAHIWLDGPLADVVVTDLWADPAVLSQGLLTALQQAVTNGLMAAGARLVPERIAVRGALVQCRQPAAAGFDLDGALRQLQWYPGVEPVQLERWVALLWMRGGAGEHCCRNQNAHNPQSFPLTTALLFNPAPHIIHSPQQAWDLAAVSADRTCRAAAAASAPSFRCCNRPQPHPNPQCLPH